MLAYSNGPLAWNDDDLIYRPTRNAQLPLARMGCNKGRSKEPQRIYLTSTRSL